MKLDLSSLDFLEFFSQAFYERGYDYLRQNKVVDARLNKSHLVRASVKGSGRNLYNQQIQLIVEQGKIQDIDGYCSCPVHFNCKHVVAALLEVQQQQQQTRDSTTRSREVSATTDSWVNQLKVAQHNFLTKKASLESRNELLVYILDLNPYPDKNIVEVFTAKVRQKKDGGFSQPKPQNSLPATTASYVDSRDRILLGMLNSLVYGKAAIHPQLVGEESGRVLEELIESGRCFWESTDTPAIFHGDTLSTSLSWEMRDDLRQKLVASSLEREVVLLPVVPPRYLDPATGECGLLETGLPDEVASLLIASPAVTIDEIPQLHEIFSKEFSDINLPLPVIPEVVERQDITPKVYLRLSADQKSGFYADEEPEGIATLSMGYGSLRVNPLSGSAHLIQPDNQRYEKILRDRDFEMDVIDQLDELGFIVDEFHTQTDSRSLLLEPVHSSEVWFDFFLNHKQDLEQEGWQIEVSESFPFRIEQGDHWYGKVTSADNEWFDLEMGIELDGKPVNLLPFLVSYLSDFKSVRDIQELSRQDDDYPLMLPLEDRRYLHIPFKKVRHIIETLTELYDPEALNDQGHLRLSSYQSNQLHELEIRQSDLVWSGGEKLRKFGEQIRDFEGIKQVTLPSTLKAELREYQKTGVNWLQFLRQYGLAGILADDMGLGKTVQTLAHLLVEKKAGRANLPNLVVAPTSLMFNWQRETERFAPSLKVLVYHGTERKQLVDKFKEYNLILTTFPLLSRDEHVLLNQQFHYVILDEAQHIKNPLSKAAQTAFQLKSRHRLCLTGTPLENHLGELWSQFHFLMPGMLGDDRKFRRLFRNPIEKHQDSERQSQLRHRITPFVLRREKSQVATELPPKTEIISEVELEGAQRDLYETVRVSMNSKVRQAIDAKGIARSQIVILDALLKLRQICCHPQLLKLSSAQNVRQSAKMNQLMEMLPEMIEEGRRVLLFSQFTSMLSLIELELNRKNISYVKLTGQTRNRTLPVDAFQNGEVPLFLISLKAGGSGLNLTAADTVIHYDPWWNPAVENQATDRAYRIGQDKPVFVYKMITVGSVEEKIMQMQQKKKALADALYADTGGQAGITAEDLQGLFEPLA